MRPPSEYQQRLRISRARELLELSRDSADWYDAESILESYTHRDPPLNCVAEPSVSDNAGFHLVTRSHHASIHTFDEVCCLDQKHPPLRINADHHMHSEVEPDRSRLAQGPKADLIALLMDRENGSAQHPSGTAHTSGTLRRGVRAAHDPMSAHRRATRGAESPVG